MLIGHSGLRHFLVQKDQWMQQKGKIRKKRLHTYSRYTVYVNKCHACHAKRRGVTGDQSSPSAPPEPAQCPRCHACHAKRRWYHQVPRLPPETKVDVAKSPGATPATQSVTHHRSHTIFHTPHCHTPAFAHRHRPSFTHHSSQHFVSHDLSPHHLSHTTLSHTIFHHTIFHTQLCHTPSFATPSFTHHFVTHHLSHTTLSHARNFHTHTIFDTQLCHTHTHHLSLSHTRFHIQLFHTQLFFTLQFFNPPPPPLSFLPSLSPLQHLVLGKSWACKHWKIKNIYFVIFVSCFCHSGLSLWIWVVIYVSFLSFCCHFIVILLSFWERENEQKTL